MYLICFGTRPELIKLIPLINIFKVKKIKFKTLFTGQHNTLITDFLSYIDKPDYCLEGVMEHNQGLNKLISKIIDKIDNILLEDIFDIIVQGDTSSTLAIALAGFNRKLKIIHIEAGLRTYDKLNPFPEEINRCLISRLTDFHLCPTQNAVNNLKKEGINENVYLVGNTIVDSYNYFISDTKPSLYIQNEIISKYKKYIICTIHRNENRENKLIIWNQLNDLINNIDFKIVYIKHPSLLESEKFLNSNILLLDPINYIDMVHLIHNSNGIISDSGGIQEEAVCAQKKILICRKTTERSEVIDCGLGKLVDLNIKDNINFLYETSDQIISNPFGENVCKKIINII